jgi:hypothetical protein
MASTSNWTKFKWPYEPMKNFTRHEPIDDDLKATYLGGLRKKRKSDRTLGSQALEALQKRRAHA